MSQLCKKIKTKHNYVIISLAGIYIPYMNSFYRLRYIIKEKGAKQIDNNKMIFTAAINMYRCITKVMEHFDYYKVYEFCVDDSTKYYELMKYAIKDLQDRIGATTSSSIRECIDVLKIIIPSLDFKKLSDFVCYITKITKGEILREIVKNYNVFSDKIRRGIIDADFLRTALHEAIRAGNSIIEKDYFYFFITLLGHFKNFFKISKKIDDKVIKNITHALGYKYRANHSILIVERDFFVFNTINGSKKNKDNLSLKSIEKSMTFALNIFLIIIIVFCVTFFIFCFFYEHIKDKRIYANKYTKMFLKGHEKCMIGKKMWGYNFSIEKAPAGDINYRNVGDARFVDLFVDRSSLSIERIIKNFQDVMKGDEINLRHLVYTEELESYTEIESKKIKTEFLLREINNIDEYDQYVVEYKNRPVFEITSYSLNWNLNNFTNFMLFMRSIRHTVTKEIALFYFYEVYKINEFMSLTV